MKSYLNGLQHIGIPTKNFEETLAFYSGLGLELTMRTKNGEADVAFLSLGSLVIEIYTGEAVGATGSIHHIAIDVSDVEQVFQLAQQAGYKLLDEQIRFLPFFENGVKFFSIEGPNAERLEFNQKL